MHKEERKSQKNAVIKKSCCSPRNKQINLLKTVCCGLQKNVEEKCFFEREKKFFLTDFFFAKLKVLVREKKMGWKEKKREKRFLQETTSFLFFKAIKII